MSIRYLFPDNTVLCNFAVVERLDLLETILNGRGRWTSAVAGEAEASARHLPALHALVGGGWMGEPIEIIEDADILRIDRIRRVVFGGTDAKPLQHLGEAETCHVMRTWPEFASSWWVSDDREALRYAKRQDIPAYETLDLMAMAVSDGDIDGAGAFVLMERMTSRGRSVRMPAGRESFRR
jgi:predicted nucleic acid-binding protein